MTVSWNNYTYRLKAHELFWKLLPLKFFLHSYNFRDPTSTWFYQKFSNLKPYTTYIINVTCKSDKGIGPSANITLITKQYGKAMVLKIDKETEFYLVWIFYFEIEKMNKFHLFMFCNLSMEIN